jgi:copper chaperone CopZ
VQKALESVPGVRQAKYDHGTKEAQILVDKGKKLDSEAIAQSLKDAGFGGEVMN